MLARLTALERFADNPRMRIRSSFLAAVLLLVGGCKSGPALLQVEAVPESTNSEFSVWDAKLTKTVVELGYPGKPVELAPGRYSVTRYLSKRWVWAEDIEVAKGKTTVVKLGALKVVPPPGVDDEQKYSIQNPKEDFVAELAYAGKLIAAPAGDYQITGYLESTWKLGKVSVRAGEASEMKVGALKVTVPEGTHDTALSVHDPATGERTCVRRQFGDVFIAPLTKLRLQTSLDVTVLAEVEPVAGKILEVPVGAIVWNGPNPRVELVTKAGARGRTHSFAKGSPIAAGAGEWNIVSDDASHAALATVTVEPGKIAEAP